MVKTIPNNENNNTSRFPSQGLNSITRVSSSNIFTKPKGRGGRPHKPSNPLDNIPIYTLDEIFRKHTRVQEYNEFSRLVVFFLTYGCAGNSGHRLRNYLSLPTNGASRRGNRQSFLFSNNEKSPFFKFLTIIIERTAKNICLNEFIEDLLIEIAETYSGYCLGPNPLEKTRNVFMGNALKSDQIKYFMDSFLFDEIITIFGEWKKLFFEKILTSNYI